MNSIQTSSGSGRVSMSAGKMIPGFTLIELLVVISLIGVLVSMLLPALSMARETAKLTICMTHERQVLRGLSNYLYDFKDQQPLWSAYADPTQLPYFDYLHPVAVANYLNIGDVSGVAFDSTGVNGRWAALARNISNHGIARKSVLFCPNENTNPIYNEDQNGWMQLGNYAAGWAAWSPAHNSYVDDYTQPGQLDRWLGKTLASQQHPDAAAAYVHAETQNISCYGMVNGVNTQGNWNISGFTRNVWGGNEPMSHMGKSPVGWLDGHVTHLSMNWLLDDYHNGGGQYGPTGLSPIWDFGAFTPW